MMKAKTALLALCMALLLLLTGCGQQEEKTLLGVWTLTAMKGSDDAEQSMTEYEALGMKMSMAISKSDIETVVTIAGGSDYEHASTTYTIEGTKLITEGSEMEYVLDGDTLSLTADGVTMVFTRAK